jgi:prefoldin subunit 5
MPEKSSPVLESLRSDINTLDAKVSLIVQKIKTIEKNEEVIGKTIISHNEKIKGLQEKLDSGISGPSSASVAVQDSADLDALKEQMTQLQKQVEELKYVVEMINPLDYVTRSQLRDAIAESERKKS